MAKTFFVGLCTSCWMSFGRMLNADHPPMAQSCPVCRDDVTLLFQPDEHVEPFARRALEMQEATSREIYAGLAFVLQRQGGETPMAFHPVARELMWWWGVSDATFWHVVAMLVHDELEERVLQTEEMEAEA
jgi:hypothetical protein